MSSQDGAENPLDQTQIIEFAVDISSEEEFPPLSPSTNTGASQSRLSRMSETNSMPSISVGVQSEAPSGRNSNASQGAPTLTPRRPGSVGTAKSHRSNQGSQAQRSVQAEVSIHSGVPSTIVTTSSSLRVPLAPNFPGTVPAKGAQPGATRGGGAGSKGDPIQPGIGRNATLFSSPTDILDSEIKTSAGVLVSKNDRRKAGNGLCKVRDAATKRIDPKFGVTRHFVSSASGECNDDDETKETFIQDSYALNLAKVETLDMRLIMYDLKTIFMISTLVAGVDIHKLKNIADAWNDDGIDMLFNWE